MAANRTKRLWTSSKEGKRRYAPQLPVEIWLNIYSHFPQWYKNPLVLSKLGQICRSARVAFMSDSAWKHIDPYGLSDGFAQHFSLCVSFLNDNQHEYLYGLWSGAIYQYDVDAIDEYEFADEEKLPTVGDSKNLFYDLGMILVCDLLDWKIPEVTNRDVFLSAVSINRKTYIHGCNSLQTDIEVAKRILSLDGTYMDIVHVQMTEELALIACTQIGCVLEEPPLDGFRNNDKVILAALAS